MSDDAGLSAYELERQANIRRNEEVLVALGLKDAAAALIPTRQAPTRTRKAPASRPAEQPSRKSSRIASQPAPAIYVADERANGRVTVGGKDATAEQQRAASPEARAKPSDEDEAPDSEELLHPNERRVYAALREEKNVIARELDTAAYHIAQNRALMACAARPRLDLTCMIGLCRPRRVLTARLASRCAPFAGWPATCPPPARSSFAAGGGARPR